MIDAHVHAGASLLPYLPHGRCIVNADSPEEYAFLKSRDIPYISAGIHPWKADTTSWEAMLPCLKDAPVIGEIGLDSVWCEVDSEIQKSVFRRQLALASELGKPVILHTKGMEKTVLDTVAKYPNRYLVHWYDCKEHLTDYIRLGCWFTVGPNVLHSKAVQALAKSVPLDRLLIESDGTEGMAWAADKTLTEADYPAAMEAHAQAVADLRGMDKYRLLEQMEQNLKHFLH